MHGSEVSVVIFCRENRGLGILYSQQFTGEFTDSGAAVSVTCQKADVERNKMLFQPFLMRDMIVEETPSLCIIYVTRRTSPSPCLPSQPFLLEYFSSSSIYRCGAVAHTDSIWPLCFAGLYITPLSYCPSFSCLQPIDCLINNAKISMQNHARTTSMDKHESTWIYLFACKDAYLCTDTTALLI